MFLIWLIFTKWCYSLFYSHSWLNIFPQSLAGRISKRDKEIQFFTKALYAHDIYNEVSKKFHIQRLKRIRYADLNAKLYSDEDFVVCHYDHWDKQYTKTISVKLGEIYITYTPHSDHRFSVLIESINKTKKSRKTYTILQIKMIIHVPFHLNQPSLFPWRIFMEVEVFVLLIAQWIIKKLFFNWKPLENKKGDN